MQAGAGAGAGGVGAGAGAGAGAGTKTIVQGSNYICGGEKGICRPSSFSALIFHLLL